MLSEDLYVRLLLTTEWHQIIANDPNPADAPLQEAARRYITDLNYRLHSAQPYRDNEHRRAELLAIQSGMKPARAMFDRYVGEHKCVPLGARQLLVWMTDIALDLEQEIASLE